MIRFGTLVIGEEHYNVVEQRLKDFYRIDIYNKELDWFAEQSSADFSMYRRKKTYRKGNIYLYNKMQEVIAFLQSSNVEMNITTNWKDGIFMMSKRKQISEDTYMEVIEKMGIVYTEYYFSAHVIYVINGSDDQDDYPLIPANAKEYEAVVLNKEKEYEDGEYPYLPLSVLRTRYNISHIFERDYVVVKNDEEAKERLEWQLSVAKGDAGIDTETTGLDMNKDGKDELVGIVFSTKDNTSTYYPVSHALIPNVSREFLIWFCEKLRFAKLILIAHNKKFDTKVFKKSNLPIFITKCSLNLSNIINPEFKRGIHGLKYLEEELLNETFLELNQIFIKDINFKVLPADITRIYACPDADSCRKIEHILIKKLPDYQREVYAIENELSDLKADQEYWGFRLDKENFEKGMSNAIYCRNLLRDLIKTLANTEENINSSQVLERLIYDIMGAKCQVWTKSGRRSTGVKALKKLAKLERNVPLTAIKVDIKDKYGNTIIKANDLNSKQYPLITLLLKYKEYNKEVSGFYERIERDKVGFRYYSWINQIGTLTFRQASPMHQLPKAIKEDILADSSEHILYDSDYCQIELRVLAAVAQEPELLKLCEDSTIDIHRAIGHLITGKEMWEISAEERSDGKARNFGVVYLMSPKGLAESRFGPSPTLAQIKICEDSIFEFYDTFKRIQLLINTNRETILKTGMISTRWGVVRFFPQMLDVDLPNDKKESYIRQGNNLPIQGLAAQIMKIAEINLNRYIKNKGWDKLIKTPEGEFPLVRVMLSAHDEALLSVHNSIPVEEILKMKRECMQLVIDEFCPLFVETALAKNWKEGHSDANAIPVKLRDQLIEEYEKTGKSKFSRGNEIQEMQLEINDFREKLIIQYMEMLIKEAGTDNPEVIKNMVKHPSITHDLIDRFPQSKQSKAENGNFTHLERIAYATRQFMEYRKGGYKLENVEIFKEKTTERQEEEDIKKLFSDIVGLHEDTALLDENGEIVNLEEYEDEEDDTLFMYEDEEKFIAKVTGDRDILCWKLFDAIILDTANMKKEDIDQLLAFVFELNHPNGFYKVKLFYHSKLIDTKIKVENLDLKEIEKFIQNHRESEFDYLSKVGENK